MAATGGEAAPGRPGLTPRSPGPPKRILFVAFRFPPYNTAGAVRAAKLARYWHQRGADLKVLSAAPQAFPDTLPVGIPEDRVTRTAWLDVNALPALLLGGRRRTASEGYFTERRAISGVLKRNVVSLSIFRRRDLFTKVPGKMSPCASFCVQP